MIAISCKDLESPPEAAIACECRKCGRKYSHRLTESETLEFMRLKASGSPVPRPLAGRFPGVPAWILAGALDPLAGGNALCPDCERKGHR